MLCAMLNHFWPSATFFVPALNSFGVKSLQN
jgi:hypothetical protein